MADDRVVYLSDRFFFLTSVLRSLTAWSAGGAPGFPLSVSVKPSRVSRIACSSSGFSGLPSALCAFVGGAALNSSSYLMLAMPIDGQAHHSPYSPSRQ